MNGQLVCPFTGGSLARKVGGEYLASKKLVAGKFTRKLINPPTPYFMQNTPPRTALPAGITQQRLAERTKLSLRTVQNYLSGKPVRPDTQRRITRVLNKTKSNA